MPELSRRNDVFVLALDADSENRFTSDWLATVESAIDAVENAKPPAALVTVSCGKFFSNGLDTDWLAEHPSAYSSYLTRVQSLLARTLEMRTVCVAALGGHAFGAGAIWALAHDFRVARNERGYFCLPEVDLGLPFTPGMAKLVQARLPAQAAHYAMTTGKRYSGAEAAHAGIVDVATDGDDLASAAIELAESLSSKSQSVRSGIKSEMYRSTLSALRTPVTGRSPL